MCWSGEASTTIAVAGFAATAYCYRSGRPKPHSLALGYFSVTEAIQAFSYTVIGNCRDQGNQIATMLAYIHIAFQPFILNTVALHFIPRNIRLRIKKMVYLICLLAAAFLLIRIYPISGIPFCYQTKYTFFFCKSCRMTPPFCGREICSYFGNWHLAWAAPLKSHPFLDNWYLISIFIVPFLYGSWKFTVYLGLSGLLVPFVLTNNPNEWIAVWCLFSIGLIGLIIIPKLEKLFQVKSWFWWKYLKNKVN